MRRSRWLFVCAALVLGQGAAAVPIADNLLSITQEGVGTMNINGDDLGCVAGEKAGTFLCDGTGQTFLPPNPNFTWELSDWNITLDLDPMINIGFGFKNVGATATFTITSSIPVAPIGPGTLSGGSTGGSVTDDGDAVGGLGTSAPDPFFVGLLDGVPHLPTSLHPDPSNFPGAGFPGAFLFGGQTVNIPAVFSGLPGPTIPGPAVAATIGIRHRFQLATQDSMGASSFFQVVVIPEPATGALLGLGLVGLAASRRRKR